MPLKYALMVSVKATARGTLSVILVVRGLGPREDPIGIDVVLNVTGALFRNGLFLPDGLAGTCVNKDTRHLFSILGLH